MKRTAVIASELCNKEITTDDAFKMLMALKLSRLSYSPDHFDSFTDLIGYTEGWWKFREEQKGTTMMSGQEDAFEYYDTIARLRDKEEAEKKAVAAKKHYEEEMALKDAINFITDRGFTVVTPQVIDWKDANK